MIKHTPGTRVGDYVTTATPVGSKVEIGARYWHESVPKPELEFLGHKGNTCYVVGRLYPANMSKDVVYDGPSGDDFYIVKELPAKDTK
jgi:hypothetical protein